MTNDLITSPAPRLPAAVAVAERWQVPLYLGALALGALVGLLLPGGTRMDAAITPLLMLLLYATFLAVPFTRIREAARDLRFMGALLVLNFAIVPVVVFGLSRFVASDRALLVGVLLVLLTPCVDYVMVFTRLAGGDATRLLAASPLLMLAQILLLPVFLVAIAGEDAVDAIHWMPFATAFLLVVVVPLGLSLTTQRVADTVPVARRLMDRTEALMVPVMMLTLTVIAASQIDDVVDEADRLVRVIPLFAVFLAAMPVIGALLGRRTGQSVGARRALAFSGTTRNSLVVLPLALSLPDALSLAAAVVVMQTLIELVGMVALTRVVPRLIR